MPVSLIAGGSLLMVAKLRINVLSRPHPLQSHPSLDSGRTENLQTCTVFGILRERSTTLLHSLNILLKEHNNKK